MNWSGRGPILRREVATYVDMPFIPCTEEETYASCLPLIVRNGSELADAAPINYSRVCRVLAPF